MTPSPPVSSHASVEANIAVVLTTLKDVAGVSGSFVFLPNGRLVAREIHAMFDDGALGEAAERLARLYDTFTSVGDELDLAVIRFADHKLYLKVVPGGMLCIVADGTVNMPALRMAANLVGRRIAHNLERANALPSHALQSHAAVVEAPPMERSERSRGPVMAPGTGVRKFRGRTVE